MLSEFAGEIEFGPEYGIVKICDAPSLWIDNSPFLPQSPFHICAAIITNVRASPIADDTRILAAQGIIVIFS